MKNEKENENTDKPEVPQKPTQSEIAEDKNSAGNSGENNSEIDKIIIDPENNSDTQSENNSDDNSETEVTSSGESV